MREKFPLRYFASLPGVKEAIPVETPYKLISREYTKFFKGPSEDKLIKVGNVVIGGGKPVYIAGPCAVESRISGDENSRRSQKSRSSYSYEEVSSNLEVQSILSRA